MLGTTSTTEPAAFLPYLTHPDGVDRRLDAVRAVADGECLGLESDRTPVRGGRARGVHVHISRLAG